MYGVVVTMVVVVMAVILVMMVKVMVVPTPTSHSRLLLHMLGEEHRFSGAIFQNIQRGHLRSGQAIALQLWVSWCLEVPEVPERRQQVMRVMVMWMVAAWMSVTSRDTVCTQGAEARS